MSGIRPNKDQFIELMNAPDEGPVVMLNLLKFKAREGASEYNKYGGAVVQMVEASGGKVLWMGKVDLKADYRIPIVFDNLIYKREMPVTIGVFINPGRTPDQKEASGSDSKERLTAELNGPCMALMSGGKSSASAR